MFSRRLELTAAIALLTLTSVSAHADSRPASAAPAAATAALLPGFDGWPTGAMEIRAKAGRQWFKVVVADTPERQERGLMFVTRLPREVGMVFPQAPPKVASFWMRNTLIPLDLLFLGPNHRVVYIRESAPVQSDDIITMPDPVVAVLELVGGESARRGIKVGDRFTATGIATLR